MRKNGPRNSACTSSVAGGRVDAASTTVGSSLATSTAKLGPDSTTTARSGPSSSAITSDIRSSVPLSSPFVALTTVACGCR